MKRIVRAFSDSLVLLFALIPAALVRLPAQVKSPTQANPLVQATAQQQSAQRQPDTPPILSLNPAAARRNIVGAAKSHLGTPYRSGGTDSKGLDCSGLVVLSFKEATGRDVPRTVAEQVQWVVAIPRGELEPGDLVFFNLDNGQNNTPYIKPDTVLGSTLTTPIGFWKKSPPAKERAKADHVGIYIGEGAFVHAASAGSRAGVTINSLKERSWDERFLLAGRAVSATLLSGLAVDLQLDASLGAGGTSTSSIAPAFRGLSAGAALSFPLGSNFRIGLETGLSWDNFLHTARIPLELVVGQISGFSVFAGPAFTMGAPHLSGASGGTTGGATASTDDDVPLDTTRNYLAPTTWLSTVGIRWSPLFIGSSPTRGGVVVELRYDQYKNAAGQPAALFDDVRAALTLGVGIRLRSVHY
ncbi:MAG TPA: C40 family peptidase [Spirochaetales bacterium]|nr:C40 family peptidase [Spirochaetales bacterium]